MANKKQVDIHELTKGLFMVLGEESPITQRKDGVFMINGKAIDNSQKIEIISSAKTLKKFPLLDLLFAEMRYIACKKMYNEGGSDLEMLKGGKWMLYTIDVLEKKIASLSNLK